MESLLVCPVCRGSLLWAGQGGAECATCGTTFVGEAGVSYLIRDARTVEHGDTAQRARLIESARLYDWVQRSLGRRAAFLRLQSALGDTARQSLVDVGGGTGSLVPFLSPGTHYLCIDNDAGKIRRLLAKWPDINAVVGDATSLPLRDKSIDVAVCVALTHHLGDKSLLRLIQELARVTRQRVVVFDPVRENRSWRWRLLWRIDRGSFPRSDFELESLLEVALTRQSVERFAIHHHSLIWVGRPTDTLETAVAPRPGFQ